MARLIFVEASPILEPSAKKTEEVHSSFCSTMYVNLSFKQAKLLYFCFKIHHNEHLKLCLLLKIKTHETIFEIYVCLHVWSIFKHSSYKSCFCRNYWLNDQCLSRKQRTILG